MNYYQTRKMTYTEEEIVKRTKDWNLNDWKAFRKLNNYWVQLDIALSSKNPFDLVNFKDNKLVWIKRFNDKENLQ